VLVSRFKAHCLKLIVDQPAGARELPTMERREFITLLGGG
jgi:hypothetical protein